MGVGSQGLYMGTWDWSSDNVINCGQSAASCTFGQYWNQEYGTDVWRSPDGVHWTSVSKVGLGDGRNTGSRSFAATPYGLFMGTARSVGGTQVFNLDNGSNPTGPLTPPVVHSAAAGTIPTGTVSITWNAVSGATDYLVYRITSSPSETTPPPAAAHPLALAACSEPDAPSICSMSPQLQGKAATALFGYPSAPQYRGRVTSTAFNEASANALQSLYYVVAEDSLGNVSYPSNVVGGPSLAAQ
jgi:hypothetical protein